MTKLLERAIAEAAALSDEEQDAIASRILAEIEDERGWEARFAATSDAQWDRIAEFARRSITTGRSTSLDDLVREHRH
jgi:hypothetical protein